MFNRLPPELVRQIIESSAPSTYHYETYADRQATLCQFCVVCKLFREIAQPLLFEIVYIDWQWNIDHAAIKVAPTLLNPVVLPSLRSLALIRIYDDDETPYLNRSRLADLVPQLESLFLNSRIIQRGLGYLIPALSRTLFEFYHPSSDARIDPLQVAQHLRIPKQLDPKDVIQKFIVSIENQDRQISLRSIYLDIDLEDLSSLSLKEAKAVEDLLRVCMEKRIEIIYEAQEVGLVGELRPSEEFRRRQREIRMTEANSE
ncbi:hypothetical protein JCM5353_005967 [Sporobolomyces roseus]